MSREATGDGALVDFRSAVDAVRCAIEVQNAMVERNAWVPSHRQIEFRIGIHLGDVVESDGDLMGDGVNIAARLEGIAQPGAICLSEDAYRQERARLDLAVSDLGDKELKNIVEPMRVYSLQVGLGVAAKPPAAAKPAKEERPVPAFALPDRPSIAVLPFQNMSGDPEQEYFVDGMVEDIITGLSRIKWLFVIARNSSFTYRGKAVDVRQVGRELGVRYVLEGGVRKAGNRLRITGQLIEAETGAHLWADRFDGGVEDVFDLQDRITQSIVGIIEPSLQRAEIERAQRKRPDSLDAYDLYLRAVPYMASAMPEDAAIGMGYLEDALKLDPNYAVAHAYLAWGLEIRFVRGGFSPADAAAGLRHARAALAHRADDATALAVASLSILHLGHDFDAAAGAIARAVALNGSCATAFYLGAHIHAMKGDAAVAEDFADKALRLSPFDPLSYFAWHAMGTVRVRKGQFDDAAGYYLKATQAILASACSTLFTQRRSRGRAGRLDEARLVASRLLAAEPNFRLGAFVAGFAQVLHADLAESIAVGLRRAGLPE
jgi:adenylate cyclase